MDIRNIFKDFEELVVKSSSKLKGHALDSFIDVRNEVILMFIMSQLTHDKDITPLLNFVDPETTVVTCEDVQYLQQQLVFMRKLCGQKK
jgi:hypothetical protein